MSGGGRHTVFKDMEIGAWPNGLTLDHLEKRIVWTDARYTISASRCRGVISLPPSALRARVTSYDVKSRRRLIRNLERIAISPSGR